MCGLDNLDTFAGTGIAITRDDEAFARAPNGFDRLGHPCRGLARTHHDKAPFGPWRKSRAKALYRIGDFDRAVEECAKQSGNVAVDVSHEAWSVNWPYGCAITAEGAVCQVSCRPEQPQLDKGPPARDGRAHDHVISSGRRRRSHRRNAQIRGGSRPRASCAVGIPGDDPDGQCSWVLSYGVFRGVVIPSRGRTLEPVCHDRCAWRLYHVLGVLA